MRNLMLILTLLVIAGCRKTPGIPLTLAVSPLADTINGVITISGSGFSSTPSENSVMFNDSTPGTVLTASPTELTVLVAPYNSKNRISVKANGVTQETSQEFQVLPKFFPQAEGPGYSITLYVGGGLNPSDYSVSFNGTQATVTASDNYLLTVTVPSGATSGPITVTYKGLPATSLTDFTITPVGSVASISQLGSFADPSGLAFDSQGNLYAADVEGGVIDQVNVVSGAISSYAGEGTVNFNYMGGSPLLSASIYGANQISFGPGGYLYATNTWYGPLYRITPDSATLYVPLGSLGSPCGLYIDSLGNFYLTDGLQIQKITAGGNISVLAGSGLQGYINGPAAQASFAGPSSLILDPSGNIYVADVVEVREVSNGGVSIFAGGGTTGYRDGPGWAAGFTYLGCLVRDPATGNIYATDPGDHVVRMISPTGIVTTIAGNPGQAGSQNGVGIQATFEGPGGIALDKSGNIYVTDGSFTTSNIRKITLH